MANDYPSLPWDPPEVRSLRVRLQKPRVAEDPEAFYLHRRFSIYLTLFFASRFPQVAPNHLTLTAVLLAYLTPVVAAFLSPVLGLWLLFLAYHLVYTLDLVDGELARYTGRTSALGRWLDRLLAWGVHVLALGAYLLLAWSGPPPFLLLGPSAYLFRWAVAEARAGLQGGQGTGGGPALLRWLLSPSGMIAGALFAALSGFEPLALGFFPAAYVAVGVRNAWGVVRSLRG